MKIRLTPTEEKSIQKWLDSREVKQHKPTSEVAVVFSQDSGIGVSVTVIVRDKAGAMLTQDVTDYHSW